MNDPTRLLLIRHGECRGSAEGRLHGWTDVALSRAGLSQSRALRDVLREMPMAAIYATDLRRSRRCAGILGRPHGVRPRLEPAFREISMGRWEGMTWNEILAREPQRGRRWLRAGGGLPFPGGERLAAFRARVLRALKAVVRRHRGETIALVGHAGTNRVILGHALGLPPRRLFSIRQDFGAISQIEYHPSGAIVVRLNDTCHLASKFGGRFRGVAPPPEVT